MSTADFNHGQRVIVKETHNTEEIIVPIPGFEDRYRISSHGKILLKNGEEKVLYYVPYAQTVITVKGKMTCLRLHRLLAEAFIPNPNNYPCINHKDGNRRNNRLENLEWCTQKHNVNHASQMGLRKNQTRGERVWSSKLTEQQVLEIRRLGKYDTPTKIGAKYGVSPQAIEGVLTNKYWKHLL